MNLASKIFFYTFATVLFLCLTQNVQAGWMDKLNEATNKINQASQKAQQVETSKQQVQNVSQKVKQYTKTKTTNPIKGQWGDQKTCEQNSATCMNGMDDIINCMHQTKGYYYKLVAAHFIKQLSKDNNFTEEERREIEEDISSLEDAVETDQVVDPDPENPQRYLKRLSKEDQMEINRLNSNYMNEVRTDCDQRFGGMSRYSGTGGQ